MGRPRAIELHKKCVICDKEFTTRDTKRGRLVATCGEQSCRSKLAVNKITTEKSCVVCKEIILVKDTATNPHCEDCEKNRNKVIKNCEICGKECFIKKDSRTCSKKCASVLAQKNLVDIECYHCHIVFKRPSITYVDGRRHFCSSKCNNANYSLENPTRYGGTWPTRKRKAMERDHHKCLLCKSEESLQVHHFKKVLSFDNPNDAHYSENLGTFCVDCHEKVESLYSSLSDFEKRYSLNI